MTRSAPAPALVPGDLVAGDEYRLSPADLVRYAGASRDFNPLHWSPRIAAEAGLPGVIAHGTLLLGLVSRLLSRRLGDPARLTELTFRFLRPVVVPEGGVAVALEARVADRQPDSGLALTIVATVAGAGTVGRGRALVRP
ncbi:MaoC/PaaZ C-terminal domain-containing protein [Jiangella anatolica]|uniref:Dehydratase n=1 Tax=Jiangella anatolica TaxID=2670374 RepID=A0A2W2B509_9ACTN|nr:MaoC/PaaZ C-terminal domain-containing protein [Jiangella anatolica]PZF81112.1 dehydratase [Jiangella anatolica]